MNTPINSYTSSSNASLYMFRISAAICRLVGWEPVYAVNVLQIQPSSCLMLPEHWGPINNFAPEALHAEMKSRIVIFNSREEISNGNLGIQFFLYLPY